MPKYIAESYGDRYSDKTLGIKKLEKAAQIISDIIAKLDLINVLTEDEAFKEVLLKTIKILQEFMIINDSVTVATEVPVLLDWQDVYHFKHQLRFHVLLQLAEDEVITGHIDMVQVRNDRVHIMDYKPNAKKVKPMEQLTIYALALSRLTTLRLYHFKCAWFDDQNYFEFYPLHVVYKRKKSRKSKRKKFDISSKKNEIMSRGKMPFRQIKSGKFLDS